MAAQVTVANIDGLVLLKVTDFGGGELRHFMATEGARILAEDILDAVEGAEFVQEERRAERLAVSESEGKTDG